MHRNIFCRFEGNNCRARIAKPSSVLRMPSGGGKGMMGGKGDKGGKGGNNPNMGGRHWEILGRGNPNRYSSCLTQQFCLMLAYYNSIQFTLHGHSCLASGMMGMMPQQVPAAADSDLCVQVNLSEAFMS